MINISAIKPTTLKSILSSNATVIQLKQLLDRDNNLVSWAQLQTDWLVVVVKQGDKWEQIKCDGLTQNPNGTATLSIAPSGRHILPIPPYSGSSTGFEFSLADVIVTNDMLTMTGFAQTSIANTWAGKQTFAVSPQVPTPANPTDGANKAYVDAVDIATDAVISALDSANVKKTGNQTVDGVKTFTSSPVIPTPVNIEEAVNKGYVDTLAILGAPNASNTNNGIVRLDSNPDKTLGTPTITVASPAVVTLNAHGLLSGDTIRFTTTGALPTGLNIGITYYVISTGLTINDFRISTTYNGTAIITTGTQSGVHTLIRNTPKVISENSSIFVDNATKNAIPANDAGRVPKLEADGFLNPLFIKEIPTSILPNGIMEVDVSTNGVTVTQINSNKIETVNTKNYPAGFFTSNSGIRLRGAWYQEFQSANGGSSNIVNIKLNGTTVLSCAIENESFTKVTFTGDTEFDLIILNNNSLTSQKTIRKFNSKVTSPVLVATPYGRAFRNYDAGTASTSAINLSGAVELIIEFYVGCYGNGNAGKILQKSLIIEKIGL